MGGGAAASALKPSSPATNAGRREPSQPTWWPGGRLQKDNCHPWESNDRASSTMRKRIPPLMSWARSPLARSRAHAATCLSSRRCCMPPLCLFELPPNRRVGDAGGGTSGVARGRSPAPCCHRTGVSHRSPEDAKQREPDSGGEQHTWKNTVPARPDTCSIFLCRPFRGPHHPPLRLPQEVPTGGGLVCLYFMCFWTEKKKAFNLMTVVRPI